MKILAPILLSLLVGCSSPKILPEPKWTASPNQRMVETLIHTNALYQLAFTGNVPVLGDSVSNSPYATQEGGEIWADQLQQEDSQANFQIYATPGVNAAYVENTELPLVNQEARNCTAAFATMGANDYNVSDASKETDWLR